ncbi:MAG: polysaccharide deacetylase family protein [Pseudomonadota bacterium]
MRVFALVAAAILFVAPAFAETEKRIALSFDDAPRGDGFMFSGEERTDALIAALEAADVEQAAMFVTTRQIDGEIAFERIIKYARAGHVIANHSHSHPWLHRTRTDDYIADIDRAEQALNDFPGRRPWFRFPFLDEGRTVEKRDTVRAALADRGLMNGYVTVDTFDWHMEDITRRALRDGGCFDREKAGALYVEMFVAAAEHFHALSLAALDRAPAHMMLLHENDYAALFVGDLVDGLRKAGWEIISADEAYTDPLAQTEPQTLYANDGRVASLVFEAGVPRDRIDHASSDRDAINARFADADVFVCE